MFAEFDQQLAHTLEEIRSQGLYKTERIITTPQDAHITVGRRQARSQFLARTITLDWPDHPALIAAAKEALDNSRLRHGERPFHFAEPRTFTKSWKAR